MLQKRKKVYHKHALYTYCIPTDTLTETHLFKHLYVLTHTHVHTDKYICIPSGDESDRLGVPKNTSAPRITNFRPLRALQ